MKRLVWVLQTDGRNIVGFNTKKEELGYLTLELLGRHPHWVWYQMSDVYMSAGCLDEVRDMQKRLSNFRKKDADLSKVVILDEGEI